MLVDTHCHINLMVKEKFDTPIQSKHFKLADKIVDEALDKGVEYILNSGTSVIESQNCISLAQKNEHLFAAVGIHPCDITPNWNKDLKKIIEFLKNKNKNKIVAIGECGLDLYHKKDNITQQKDLFKAQIELSLQYNLPLTIHTRESTDEMFSCLEQFKNENLKGVMHCFSGDKAFANYVIGLGFIIGIGGPITYPKNEKLRETVSQIPLDKIILETDAPFLPPQIIRGKQNHPKYIKHIAEYIAKLKKINFETIAQETTNNAINLFNFEL